MKTQPQLTIVTSMLILSALFVANSYSCESVISDMEVISNCQCNDNYNTCEGVYTIQFTYACGNVSCCPGETCKTTGWTDGPLFLSYPCVGSCTVPGDCSLNLDAPRYTPATCIPHCDCR